MIPKRQVISAFVALSAFVATAHGNLTIQVQQTNGQILLQWQSQSNHSYRVLAADQIGQAWITQLTNLPVMNTTPRLSYIDPITAFQGSRFYRIAELSNSQPIFNYRENECRHFKPFHYQCCRCGHNDNKLQQCGSHELFDNALHK